MRYDSKGSIENVSVRGLTHGHSFCNTCGKDMPRCWDTVCSVCWDTLCYEHSYAVGEYWYCKEHKPKFGERICQFIRKIFQQ